jgi:hypothetical protein
LAPHYYRKAVDQTGERNAESQIGLGVSALGALGSSICARMSMKPKRTGHGLPADFALLFRPDIVKISLDSEAALSLRAAAAGETAVEASVG